MTDEEFISYCEAHSATPRSGFVPKHIARMLRLAGREEQAAEWDKQPDNIISVDLRPLCKEAHAFRGKTGPHA